MDSRTVMSPVCSDQGTGQVIKGPTSVPPSWLPPQAVVNPGTWWQRFRRQGDIVSSCEELISVTWRAWALPPRESQARLLGSRPDGRRVAQPSPEPEGQPGQGLRAPIDLIIARAARQTLPSRCPPSVSTGLLAPHTLLEGAVTAPSLRRYRMDRSMQRLTLPPREGPAWPCSQPATGRPTW